MTISEELRERIAAELRNIDWCDMTYGEYIDALADAVGSGAIGTIHERLADLVEPQLPEGVEWPRFEDGELVKVGDDVEYERETMRVYLATFDSDGWALWCSREGIDGRLSGSYGERVKRPDSWRLWGEDLDMAVKAGEADKVEMMRRAKALAKADSEARGVE